MIYVDVINPLILGTKELEIQAKEINIYPNPVADKLFISSSGLSGNSTIAIYNILGELIYTKETNSKQEIVNCKSFSAGIYILQIKTEGSSAVSRFVKE